MTNTAELVFILDRSGSMAGLEQDTIGGFNAMLKKQKALEGAARVTTVLFDNHYELLHDRIDIQAVSPITEKEYFVRGTTALMDAVGKTIQKIDNVQKSTAAKNRADRVLFVIITDGMENASRTYSETKIRQMIEERKKEHDWEFIFLGANIDAVEAAENIGIAPERARNYHADKQGTGSMYRSVCGATESFRKSGKVNENWDAEVRADYEKRKKDTPDD
ncbi:hypothetical protein LJC40_05560 [Synergistaceae bacterium OttesenSCG-928-D05]|nr:hypothetical protein [Synergistaceae bacterium OttesenSCG-928-D05]